MTTLGRMLVCGSVLLLAGFPPGSASAQDAPKAEAPHQEKPGSYPTCLYCPNPDYPDKARKAKILSARVLVDAIITENGQVDPSSIRVLKDPGNDFADEAVKAVKKWKLKPATKDGKPISTRVPIEVTFRSSG